MKYNQIDSIRHLMKRSQDRISQCDMLARSKSYSEFMMNYNIMFGDSEMDFDMFMTILCYFLDENNQMSEHIANVLCEVAEKETILDDCLIKKMFWNTCGRWIKYNYSSKDKSKFFKLSKLMGIAGSLSLKR